MSRSRPINRRPFRRPPWRKAAAPGERGWLSGFAGGTSWNSIGVRGAADPPSPSYENSIVLVDAAELADHEENMKVVRSVGEMFFVMDGTSIGSCLVRLGLLEVSARIDPATSAELIDYVSPNQLDEQDKSWLWMDTVFVGEPDKDFDGDTGIAKIKTATRIDFDVKNSRRLKADDRLVLYFEAQYVFKPNGNPVETGSPLHFALNMRHYCMF